MRKYLSLLLALAIVLGAIAPVVAFAEAEVENVIFDEIQYRISGAVDLLGKNNKLDIIDSLIDKIKRENLVERAHEKIINTLADEKYESLRNHINNVIGLDRGVRGDLVNAINDALYHNKLDDFVDDIKDGKLSVDGNIFITETIDNLNSTLGDSLKAELTKGKAYILFEIFDDFNKNLVVIENSDKTFTLKINNLSAEMINKHFKEGYKFTGELEDDLIAAIEDLIKEFEKYVNNNKHKIGTNTLVGQIIEELGGKYREYKEPTPGGAAPTPKKPVEVKKDTKGATITFNETEAVKEIQKAEKSYVVEVEYVEGFNLSLELSNKLVKSLVENKVDLELVTANTEVVIPAEVLEDIEVPANAKLELRVEEASTSVASRAARDLGRVKKVIDLNMVVVKGKEEVTIDSFKSELIIRLDVTGLGDEDKLAVYYLNEEDNTLEFVTGKIVNKKAVLRLAHFSKYVVLESAISFKDVENHWSKQYVESMAAKNVIHGYEDGSFKPEGHITRAEFAKMIVCALELDLVEYDGRFTDVKETDWHAAYVATLVDNGYVQGYGDNSFKPNNNITRAEMAVIIGNILDVKVSSAQVARLLGQFEDANDIPAWAKEGAAKAVKEGLMVGSANKFHPADTTTRAEAATVVYRIFNR